MFGLPILYWYFKDCLFINRSFGKLLVGLSVYNEDGTSPNFRTLVRRNNTNCLMKNLNGILKSPQSYSDIKYFTKVKKKLRNHRKIIFDDRL